MKDTAAAETTCIRVRLTLLRVACSHICAAVSHAHAHAGRSRKRHDRPGVKCPLGELIGSAVHLPCKTHNLEAPTPSHTHPLPHSLCHLRLPSRPHLQTPACCTSRRLSTTTATPQHRAATLITTQRLLLRWHSHCFSRRFSRTLVARPSTARLPSGLHPGEARMRSDRVFAATTSGHATWHNIRPNKAATTVASPRMARPPLLPPSVMLPTEPFSARLLLGAGARL
jgi:hypothetical protein